MFDIGFSEMVVIGVVALVVLGPEKLPRVARTIGALLGRAQRYVNDVKSDINRELDLADLKKVKDEVQSAATNLESTVRDGFNQAQTQFDDMGKALQDAAKLEGAEGSTPALSTPAASDLATQASSTQSPAETAKTDAQILDSLPPLAEPPPVSAAELAPAVAEAAAMPKPMMPASAVPQPPVSPLAAPPAPAKV
jgi:sec-independent protein translocase protein TatB